jgi:steroid 5-alpha reductase family enzyme
MTTLIAYALLVLSLVMILAWAFQRVVGNAGWVDVFWTVGLGGAGVAVALIPIHGGFAPTARQILIAALIAGWAIRLAAHLAIRVARGDEDVRYANFRKEWGANFERRLFWFLQIQALAAWILVVSVLLAARNPNPIGLAEWLGIAIVIIAVLGEGLADDQLRRFKSVPANKGKVCNAGLWGWSRHPNYFFEWLGWCAYPVMAIDFSGAYPWGWVAVSAPAFMYWLLVYVSGIPPLEALMLKSRGGAYRTYQARTNAFFPLPPAKAVSP